MIKNKTLIYKSESLKKHGNWLKKVKMWLFKGYIIFNHIYLDENFELGI